MMMDQKLQVVLEIREKMRCKVTRLAQRSDVGGRHYHLWLLEEAGMRIVDIHNVHCTPYAKPIAACWST
jgi:hypothetical protein